MTNLTDRLLKPLDRFADWFFNRLMGRLLKPDDNPVWERWMRRPLSYRRRFYVPHFIWSTLLILASLILLGLAISGIWIPTSPSAPVASVQLFWQRIAIFGYVQTAIQLYLLVRAALVMSSGEFAVENVEEMRISTMPFYGLCFARFAPVLLEWAIIFIGALVFHETVSVVSRWDPHFPLAGWSETAWIIGNEALSRLTRGLGLLTLAGALGFLFRRRLQPVFVGITVLMLPQVYGWLLYFIESSYQRATGNSLFSGLATNQLEGMLISLGRWLPLILAGPLLIMWLAHKHDPLTHPWPPWRKRDGFEVEIEPDPE